MLGWITSENSTKLLECRHLDLIFFAGPYLLCWSHRSGVQCWPCPWFHANSLLTRLSAVPSPTTCQLLFQPTLFRVPLPLPDTARFQVQKSFVWFHAKTDKGIVCLAGHPHSVTAAPMARKFVSPQRAPKVEPPCLASSFQLSNFLSILKKPLCASGAWRHPHPVTPFRHLGLLWYLWVARPPSARVTTYIKVCT